MAYVERWRQEGRKRQWGEPGLVRTLGDFALAFADRSGQQRNYYFRSLGEAIWYQTNRMPLGAKSTLRLAAQEF